MTTGFTSKYKDAGYTLPGEQTQNFTDGTPTIFSSWYDQNSTKIDGKYFESADIYTAAQQFGVYMFDGNKNNATLTPIVCSLTNINTANDKRNADDGYVVYPGWGFQLYNDINYAKKVTNIYVNTGIVPILFMESGDTNALTNAYKILQSGTGNSSADTGTSNINSTTQLLPNRTDSIRIYFRGVEQLITGLSS
jgi:hypothetical protein